MRVEAGRTALDDALPRMDVCGFVGFAARGPIDVPVLVEDAWVKAVEADLPELPDAKRQRYEGLGITPFASQPTTAPVPVLAPASSDSR